MSTATRSSHHHHHHHRRRVRRPFRQRAAAVVRGVMEGLLLVLIVLAPWPFGSVHPLFENLLQAGIALLLMLWGVCSILEGNFRWQLCPIGLCLGGIVLLQAVQIIPLPISLLSWISPSSSYWWTTLLPGQPESLPGESGAVASGFATISLYPAATRVMLTQTLAVFLLFSVVRNNLVSVSVLSRLSVVALGNALLLSMFALVQFFSSPTQIYWTYPIDVPFYGPFICRNHFPFYTNICVGLGLGVMLRMWTGKKRKRKSEQSFTMSYLLSRPEILWIFTIMGLVVTAGVFSMSRGGVIALLAAGVCWALLSAHLLGGRSIGMIVTLCVGVCALLWWVGSSGVEGRLGTLFDEQVVERDRVPLWLSVAPLVLRFPLFGCGDGTFGLIEPLRRRPGGDARVIWDHAHNDFLESFIEGGVIQFALIILLIYLVFRHGIRARKWMSDPQRQSTILGALAAFTTVVVHSFFDFGIHVPAIALLTTVVIALIAGLGGASRQPEAPEGFGVLTWRMGGVAPWLAAAVLLLMGLTLVGVGRRSDLVDRARRTAHLHSLEPDAEARSIQIRYLESAARLAPDDAEVESDLGEAYLQRYLDSKPKPAPADSPDLLAAMSHFRRARNLCPFLPVPQVRLAEYVEVFRQAEPREAYLARVKTLRPADVSLWYLAGKQELADGTIDEACRSWKHALLGSERLFPDITNNLITRPDAGKLLLQTMPDRPEYLLKAAIRLQEQQGFQAPGYQELLDKAMELLPPSATSSAADLRLRARINQEKGKLPEALESFKRALEKEPFKTDWRYEYAWALEEDGRLSEAFEQFSRVSKDEKFQPPGLAEHMADLFLRLPSTKAGK